MLKERLASYLKSSGLEAEDVPKVLAAFATAKPITVAAFAMCSIRYQPLTRLFARTYRPARDRVRRSWQRELERTSSIDSTYARQIRNWQRRQSAVATWFQTTHRTMRQRARQEAAKARAYRKSGISGIYEKVADWYCIKSQKYAESFAANRMWATVSECVAQDPRRLAVGVAEGLILYKALFWLHGPINLFLIVRYFQYRRACAFAA